MLGAGASLVSAEVRSGSSPTSRCGTPIMTMRDARLSFGRSIRVSVVVQPPVMNLGGREPGSVVAIAGPRVRGCLWRDQLTMICGRYQQLGGQLSLSTIAILI